MYFCISYAQNRQVTGKWDALLQLSYFHQTIDPFTPRETLHRETSHHEPHIAESHAACHVRLPRAAENSSTALSCYSTGCCYFLLIPNIFLLWYIYAYNRQLGSAWRIHCAKEGAELSSGNAGANPALFSVIFLRQLWRGNHDAVNYEEGYDEKLCAFA